MGAFCESSANACSTMRFRYTTSRTRVRTHLTASYLGESLECFARAKDLFHDDEKDGTGHLPRNQIPNKSGCSSAKSGQ